MGISVQLPQSRPSLDAVGATASVACAVHCAAVALFLGASPAISLLAAPWVDWAFLAVSAMIGVGALFPGYRRHGLRAPLVMFAFGISLLVVLRILRAAPSAGETAVVIVAAVVLIAAHWKNRGALHRCACGPQHH
jgi:MerC mercury resistance protein